MRTRPLLPQQSNPIGGWWMTRQECFDRTRIFRGLALENLEHLRHPTTIPPGSRHHLEPDTIGLALVVATEFEEDTIGHQACGHLRGARPSGIAEHGAKQSETPFRNHRLRELISGM